MKLAVDAVLLLLTVPFSVAVFDPTGFASTVATLGAPATKERMLPLYGELGQ